MKRFLRIFALLVAASMLLWIAGCGGDDDDDDVTQPPVTLVSTVPAANGSQPGNSAVSFTFSGAMTSATVTGAAGTTTVAGAVVTFKPTEPWASGSVTLSLTGKDANGNDITASLAYTATEVDITPPEKSGSDCDPADGATGVDPAGYTAVTIAVNEACKEIKLTSKDPDFKSTEKLSADGKSLVATFLQYTMSNETTFTIGVKATDLAGNVGEFEYSFTTMAKEE